MSGDFLEGVDIRADNQLEMLSNLFRGPVPPCDLFESCDSGFIEAIPDHFRWIASCDRKGRHIGDDY